MAYIGTPPSNAFTSLLKQDFSTSATTGYTLDHAVNNANDIALFINFVRQEPTAAYSASGTTLTLTSATASSDDMYCVYLGQALQTVTPASGSVTNAMLGETITVAKGGTGLTSGFKNGITDADQWRPTGTYSATSGSTTAITSGWERNDSTGYGKIGSGVTESSGVFTLPSTGIYYIEFNIRFFINSAADAQLQGFIYITTDNSTYTKVGDAVTSIHSVSNGHASASVNVLFDCTDTSTHKVKLYYHTAGGSGQVRTNSTMNRTFVTFVRLGDT